VKLAVSTVSLLQRMMIGSKTRLKPLAPESCANGTERCAAAHEALGGGYDIVVNLQGDAPLTPHWFVEDLIADLRVDPNAEISTPVLRCDGATLNSFLADRKANRVGGTTSVFDAKKRALYFSKEVVPFTSETFDDHAETPVFHHVGVYAYRPEALAAYPTWPVGPLEQLEGLEQLRFMENGRAVRCTEVQAKGRQFWELNNPEDVPRLEAMMADMGLD
jgi:3-deoxy-manno-octulosonate cytidylyltransferase (CMP-KDO synthetase)